MCDSHLSRRDVLTRAALAAGGLAVGAAFSGSGAAAAGPAVPAVEVLPGLSIYPRDAWGADLPPKKAIFPETPKFLLVHHTDSPNDYKSARDVIRLAYAWHTSSDPSKGWADVCYQFFIGRDGDVWEGRAGSLSGPVVADATGGSQGFAQLVCLLGRFATELPTPAARAALAKVLAWQADRYGIDISPGATTTFVSRGSDRWKKGTVITTRTIAGHRDMTYTECPGDAFYPTLESVRAAAEVQHELWRTTLKPARRLGRVQL